LIWSWWTTGSFAISWSVNTNISGRYYIQYNKVDAGWNNTIITRTINVIDSTPVAWTISYTTTWTTSGNVMATITLNKTGTITNNWWSLSYTFTWNGNFTFNFVDLLWNTWSATATVTWITTTSNWWGGLGLVKDSCTNGDTSASFYDGICGTNTGQQTNWSIVWSNFSTELNNAYSYAYGIGVTTMPTIQQANMEWKLIRSDLAKMMVNYAIKVLGETLNTWANCIFTDLTGQTTEMKNYILRSCQLGLMGINMDDKFNPNAEVTRAEFGTMLSRTLYGDIYEWGILYYTKHLDALKAAGIMNNITNPENTKEIRWYVMLMLMRAGE
jgi:hypothetical protein